MNPVARLRGVAGRVVRALADTQPLAALPPPARRPGVPPVVGLVGFYGWGNFGDELFLDVFREHLTPQLELRTLVRPERPTLARRLGAEIRAVDSIVIGGGDLLIPWERGSHYWHRAYLRRPVYLAGIGVPTWRKPSPPVVERLRRFVDHPNVMAIGTRDAPSTEWILTHLRPSAPVLTSPDLVWALTVPPASPPPGPPILGVAVRSSPKEDYLQHVRRLCERAMERGYRIRRIALSSGLTRRIDVEALDRLGLPETELVASDDLTVLSRAIGECSLFASMKFHGVIVATLYGVPAIALGATTKHRNLMAALGRPHLRINYADPSLPDVLDGEIAPLDPADLARLRADSIANVTGLREALLATAAQRRR